ncbi:S8 family serine peptidase [Deinococcus cellulosilyticus]|uniref:Peptidase S8/S53 domain-containing protein n=1 Tax=Deinococcus cellulosilyticus (strain DSM 18568 / NBRC 106333 / KACC 11606 / 5516J-15) TaxID=1223518 RepID=A0A511MXT3_DEIC1|nr:S8 family serine peptidase [Deinococcus cellulosilyticus]GEM45369.1 hypothetical protein DC3_10040 [Deinococcus cellulosilyticus NBRC 106333 = KACC 11606]
MKTKILSLSLCSAVLASCGLSIELFQPGDVSGKIVLPSTVVSQSLKTQQNSQPTTLAQASAVPGEYVVRLSSGMSAQSISKQGLEVRPLEVNGQPWAVVKGSSLAEVKNIPGVEYAQPNYIYQKLRIVPNDPLAQPGSTNNQWYLYEDLNGIGADHAWERKEEFKNTIKIAVVDDGYTPHADMSVNMFDLSNPGCIAATGVNCLDAYGRDASPRYEVEHLPGEESGLLSHGMQIAGIIAAETNNNRDIAGIGFNVLKVVPVRVYDKQGGTTTEILARAINTAVASGSRVINLSLCLTEVVNNRRVCYNPEDGGTDPLIDAAILNADTQGVTVVAAAGNFSSNWVGYPASNENTISVGATDPSKKRLNFVEQGQTYGSNYGPGLDMVAPGSSIRTLAISDTPVSDRTILDRGTSFSTPMVAAAAGLLYSRTPNLTNDQVRALLRDSGDVPADSSINNARFLRIDKALARLAATLDPSKYEGRVRLIQNNSTVKSTAYTKFAPGGNTLNFNLQDLPGGNYQIVAEVADSSSKEVIYKCISNIRVNGNWSRNLTVHYDSGNLPCF